MDGRIERSVGAGRLIEVFQSAVGGAGDTVGARSPWTVAQIHDTVARIAANPIYRTSTRQSLLRRFFRWLIDRINRIFDSFDGTLNPRILIAVAAAVVVAIIISRVVVARRARDGALSRRRGIRASLGNHLDYWTLARDEAAAGRYAAACHALYAAVIDGFVRDGGLTFHASKTSGDYARELRRSGNPAAQDFRAFARRFDRVVFGGEHVGADDYESLRAAAEQLIRRRAAA